MKRRAVRPRFSLYATRHRFGHRVRVGFRLLLLRRVLQAILLDQLFQSCENVFADELGEPPHARVTVTLHEHVSPSRSKVESAARCALANRVDHVL
jgi:hypothetical protein